ncbi:MAG: dienelactone hydrolase family protein [Cyclobacteriaceae bacterium]
MKIKSIYQYLPLLMAVACTTPAKEEPAEEALEVKVTGSEVEYSTDSTTMNGYLAYDENDDSKRPGIIVIHEWWGHNEHSRERAEMLAELGYVALAVDMYGDGKTADHPEGAQEFMMSVVSDMDEAMARFDAALKTLKSHPNVDTEKIGAVGYCFGGSMVLSMANAGYDLDAVAAFHAGLGLPIMPDSGVVKAKILVANGADDPWISEEQADDFKKVMAGAGAEMKYISYPGAKHAFTNKGADAMGEKFGLPLAYNAAVDSASWEEMKILFSTAF